MNCKPNQRAIVTRTCGVPGAEHFLGMVFTVREIHHTGSKFGPHWSVDPGHVYPVDAFLCPKGSPIKTVADAVLTPLPDDPDAPEQEVTDREIEHA